MTIGTPAIASIVNRLVENSDGDQIEGTLLSLGVTPCVARDWGNEPKRRAAIFSRRLARARRKEMSKYGVKYADYRRIIRTKIRGNRDYTYHATKGWRSYRRAS